MFPRNFILRPRVAAILGGSFMPYSMGRVAGHYSMGVGFLLPMGCFFFIMLYGFFWKSLFFQRHGT